MHTVSEREKGRVKQLEGKNSCVAAGFEFLLNYYEIEVVDNFQQILFDAGKVSFGLVIEALKTMEQFEQYQELEFEHSSFGDLDGAGKVGFVADKLINNRPILMAIANPLSRVEALELRPEGFIATPQEFWRATCHIMPAIAIDDNNNVIFWEPVKEQEMPVPIPQVIWNHILIPGAKDIAWLNIEVPEIAD